MTEGKHAFHARKIIHIDMDAFFASVEQRDNSDLRGKPVIVGGKPGSRGVVAACSYEARKFGVHSAMPSSQAAKLCKNAIFVPPRFEAYREASNQIHDVFNEYTKEIEPLSLDEAYLDVTERAEEVGSATLIAKQIKQQIQERVNLTASAGISYNKFLAKIASDMDKPDGIYVIRPEVAQAFIEQLEIRKFFGIGKVTEKKMHELNIFTGRDLKALTLEELRMRFGKSGSYYYNIARGIDERPVKAHRKRKSIGAERTFGENLIDKRGIWQQLVSLTERIEQVLSKKELSAKTVTLKVKYSDFELNTRSKTVLFDIVSQNQILDVLPELLKKTDVGYRPIRLIGVSVAGLQAVKSPGESDEQAAIIIKDPQMGLF